MLKQQVVNEPPTGMQNQVTDLRNLEIQGYHQPISTPCYSTFDQPIATDPYGMTSLFNAMH